MITMRKIAAETGMALLIGLLMTGCMKKLTPREQAAETTDEQKQMLLIYKQPSLIQYMPHPSEQVQMEAVRRDANTIAYIENPSEKVQLNAVAHHAMVFPKIKNPTEKVQLLAVERLKENIRYIDNPSEAVQIASLSNVSSGGFKYIKNPSERVQIEAVKRNWMIIGSIENPGEKVQLAAVDTDLQAITRIKNPTEAVQLVVVKQRPRAIQYIENPTEAVKAAAGPAAQGKSPHFYVDGDTYRRLNPGVSMWELKTHEIQDSELNYSYNEGDGNCVAVPASRKSVMKASVYQIVSMNRNTGLLLLSWMEGEQQYVAAFYPTLVHCRIGAAEYLKRKGQ